MNKLDSEEIEILDAFEKGKLTSVANAQEIEIQKAIADARFKKDVRINVHMSARESRSLKVKALQEGVSYHALVSSILHKFADGQLVYKSVNN